MHANKFYFHVLYGYGLKCSHNKLRCNKIKFNKVPRLLLCHVSCLYDLCLLAPGTFPNEDRGFGPDPCAHSNSRPKHGEQVDFLHHEAGPVLNGAFWDWLIGLRGNCHVSFTSVESITEIMSVDHAARATNTFHTYDRGTSKYGI